MLSRDGSGLDDDFTKFELTTTGFFFVVVWLSIGHVRKRGNCDSVVQVALATSFVRAFSCGFHFDASIYLIPVRITT